jgi:hypothetical protein
MSKVSNIKPDRIGSLIEQLVAQKDNVDQLIIAFVDKGGVFSSATACRSYVEAKGMVAMMDENLIHQIQNDEFEPIDLRSEN